MSVISIAQTYSQPPTPTQPLPGRGRLGKLEFLYR
jgi:hypothetical protein